jgi:hypothetical protein
MEDAMSITAEAKTENRYRSGRSRMTSAFHAIAMRGLLTGAVAAFAVSGACAEWEDYIWMTKPDTGFGLEGVSAFYDGEFWDGGNPPEEGKKYYVKPRYSIYSLDLGTSTEQRTQTFPGDELVLDNGSVIDLRSSGKCGYAFNTLRFLPGSFLMYSTGHTSLTTGRMSVESTVENPMILRMNAYEFRYSKKLDVTLLGNETACICLYDDYTELYGNPSEGDFAFVGDNSGYKGLISVSNSCALYMSGVMPGTVEVRDGGEYRSYYRLSDDRGAVDYGITDTAEVKKLIVRTGGDVKVLAGSQIKVDDLVLEDGAILTMHYNADGNGRFTVGNSIQVTGRPVIYFPEPLPVQTGTPPVYPVIELPEGCELTAEDFVLKTNPTYGALPHAGLKIEDGVLCVVCREIVKLNRSSGESGVSAFEVAQYTDGSFFWSDQLAPQEGKDYLNDGDRLMCTPKVDGQDPFVFKGESMTLYPTVSGSPRISGSGGNSARGLSFKELNVLSALFEIWSGRSVDVVRKAEIPELNFIYELTGGTVRTFGKNGRKLILSPFSRGLFLLSSTLAGDGDILCQSRNQTETSYGAGGFHEFSADNSGFTGKILVSMATRWQSTLNRYVPNETNYVRFILRDGNNIGGARETFTPDAFQLEQMSSLRPVADATIDQENLGVRISGMARMEIYGDRTLTIKNPVTYSGVLRKDGEGTLALGAKPRFLSGETEDIAPLEGTNVLAVTGGFVKPLTTDSLEGVELRVLAPGAGLAYDAVAPDAAMRRYGIRNSWQSPLVLGEGVRKVSVRIDMGSDDEEGVVPAPVALATFATEQEASGFMGLITVPSPRKGLRPSVCKESNEDGTVTVKVVFPVYGFKLVVR